MLFCARGPCIGDEAGLLTSHTGSATSVDGAIYPQTGLRMPVNFDRDAQKRSQLAVLGGNHAKTERVGSAGLAIFRHT